MTDVKTDKIMDELKRIEENMVTKDDLKSLIDTVEILSNPETMKQIEESQEEIEKGDLEPIDTVDELF
ncbi:MAG: hypothetical protein ACOCZQ_00795 [Nanoarchaeota archaeon]